jgi:hypothetical protein
VNPFVTRYRVLSFSVLIHSLLRLGHLEQFSMIAGKVYLTESVSTRAVNVLSDAKTLFSQLGILTATSFCHSPSADDATEFTSFSVIPR